MPAQGPPESAFVDFRKKLINDAAYRAKFADDPAAALRMIGIDVPQEIKIPKIDKQELEDRIQKLKTHFGDKIDSLYETADVQGYGLNLSPRVSTLGSFAAVRPVVPGIGRQGIEGFMGRAGGGTVYTISAFGTADW